jgi:hypothetical protein
MTLKDSHVVGHQGSAVSGRAGLPWEGGDGGAPSAFGMLDFTNADFYKSLDSEGVRGNATGFFAAALFTADIDPDSSEITTCFSTTPNKGWRIRVAGTGKIAFLLYNGAGSLVQSPTFDLNGDEDPNLVHGIVGTYDGALVRMYLDRVEVGSGTATTGYTAPLSTDHHEIGVRDNGTSPMDIGKILGVIGSDLGVPVLADIQTWFDNVKAERDIVDMPGAVAAEFVYSVKRGVQGLPTLWPDEKASGEDMNKNGTNLSLSSFVPQFNW